MDDAFLFSFFCLLPILLVGGLTAVVVWVVRASRDSALRRRVDELEHDNVKLERRLMDLEQWAVGLAQRPEAALDATDTIPTADVEVPADIEVPVPDAPTEVAEPEPPAEPKAAQQAAPVETPAVEEPLALEPEAAPIATPEAAPIETPATEELPTSAPEKAQTWPAPAPGFDWEQWLGVRGAAALGGLALAVAGVFFFKYSLEVGLLGPVARVVLGTSLGLGCILAAEGPLKSRYRILGDWLAGAGIALLYLSFWAASALYHLVPQWAAFVGMVAVTGTCCVLAVRRDAPAIAVLGLLGGFATPTLLSTGSDRPIALFGYLLLLNGGLLGVARRREWVALPLLSLAATALYQISWIGLRMGPERLALGIGIALVFSFVFMIGARPKSAEASPLWSGTRILAALFPFVFALFFALHSDLGPHLWPVGLMLGALCIGAAAMGLRDEQPWLSIAGAAATLATLAGWLLAHPLTGALAWEFLAVAAGLALLFHAFAEFGARRGAAPDPNAAASLFAVALMTLGLASAASAVAEAVWPLMLLWALGSVLIARQARLGAQPVVQILAALVAGAGLATLHVTHALEPGFPAEAFYLGWALVFAVGWQFAGVLGRSDGGRHFADHAAASLAILLSLHFLFVPTSAPITPALLFSAMLVLAVLASLAAARRKSGLWLFLTMATTALVYLQRVVFLDVGGIDLTATAAAVSAATLLFATAPLLLGPALRNVPGAWRAAALSPVLFFPSLLVTWDLVFGDGLHGLLAIVLAALGLSVALAARRFGPQDLLPRRTAFVWSAVAAMAFLTAAIPLQLENEWITIGWALQGVAVLALWRRVDHPGLSWFAISLFTAVVLRLVLNPYVLGYHVPSGIPVLNWLAYTYLVPMASMLASAWLLRDLEMSRRRPWERGFLGNLRAMTAGLVLVAIGVGFAWVNLTILDAFSTGRSIELSFERLPARDLTLSGAWALYGLVLLGIGMAKTSRGLRALGLGLVAITVAKVFLYDLSHLGDLWRVASLVGLAASLIVVSFAYQRFVFHKPTSEAS